jgi:DNA-binding NarL/FixJ family response regulator
MTAKKRRIKGMKMITVAIADDHALFRKGMAALIRNFEGMRLVMEAGNGKEMLDKLKGKQPDIVLMDLEMPVMDGLDATAEIVKRYPDVKVIALSQYDESNLIAHMMKHGARAYLLKTADPEEVEDTIWTVMEKGVYYNEAVSVAMHKGLSGGKPLKPGFDPLHELTERELVVLKLVCKGFTSVKIAERLNISPRTVEKQRKAILHKTGCTNTAELVAWAIKRGLGN